MNTCFTDNFRTWVVFSSQKIQKQINMGSNELINKLESTESKYFSNGIAFANKRDSKIEFLLQSSQGPSAFYFSDRKGHPLLCSCIMEHITN